MNRVIVVGHHGFVAQRLITSGRLEENTKTTSRDPEDDQCWHLDLESPDKFNFGLVASGDTIVFLAGISSPTVCKDDFDFAYRVNVEGTVHFIGCCIDIGARVIYASSDVVYGECEKAVDESSAINPLGPYAEMKAEVEGKFQTSDLFKAVRFSYIFASSDKFTSHILDCIKEHRVCEVFQPLSRSIVYVGDVVDGIVALCQQWDLVATNKINFSGPDLLSRLQFVTAFQDRFNAPQIEVIQPDEAFYEARPRTINMKSRYFEELLGRRALPLAQAIRREFDGWGTINRWSLEL